jgi:hypothetical protein
MIKGDQAKGVSCKLDTSSHACPCRAWLPPATSTDLRVPVSVLLLVVQQVQLGATLLLVWGWVQVERPH